MDNWPWEPLILVPNWGDSLPRALGVKSPKSLMNVRDIKYLPSIFCSMLYKPQCHPNMNPALYLWSSGETRFRGHLRMGEACGHGQPFQGGDSQRGLTILKGSSLTCLFWTPHSALYLSMKDTEKGIKELNLEKDKKIFNHCFTGKRSSKSEMGHHGKAICSSHSALSAGGGVMAGGWMGS